MLLNTPEAEMGWLATQFTLSDPDGKTYQLSELQGENGLVIAFICNHCPYVISIVDRFVTDAKVLQSKGINVLAINSNDYSYVPEDSPDKMRAFSKENGFTFPYLIDEDQSVAKSYGAVCTPDFFGFNKQGELQYRGRLDDARMKNSSTRKTELVDAMIQTADTGKGPTTQHPSMGCSIKWK